MSRMIEKMDLHSNGTKNSVKNKNYAVPVRLWDKLQINEWFSIHLIFVMSLAIVLGKLYMNYGNSLQLKNNPKHTISSIPAFSNITNKFELSHISDVSRSNVKYLAAVSEKFVNVSQYNVANVTTLLCKSYGWLIKATLSGLTITSYSWFIIYKDSSIPGINPPSPFAPSKEWLSRTSGIQMNYLIGALNGILIFIYMCL